MARILSIGLHVVMRVNIATFVMLAILTSSVISSAYMFERYKMDTCPKTFTVDPGNITVGCLTNIHLSEDRRPLCTILDNSGLFLSEAAKFVFRKLSEFNYINGVTIGIQIMDSCSRKDIAVGNMVKLLPETGYPRCKQPSDLAGIIGALLSPQMSDVAENLNDSSIPIISPTCTADSLSDKGTYKTFMRLVPPDKMQVEVVVQLILKLKWTYVAVIHTTDNYGREGKKQLLRLLKSHGVCTADVQEIDNDYDRSTPNKPKEIINKLTSLLQKTQQSSNLGVVYFGQIKALRTLLAVTKSNYLGKRFMWIMSDAVGDNDDLFEGYEEIGRNVLSISHNTLYIKEFEDHWLDLIESVANGTVVRPWFDKYVEKLMNCKLKAKGMETPCATKTRLNIRSVYKQPDYVAPAVDTAYVISKAIRSFHQTKCTGKGPGVCQDLIDSLKSNEFLDAIMKTDFTYPANFPFVPEKLRSSARRVRFDHKGDVVVDPNHPAYIINNYKCDTHNKCGFKSVGEYTNHKLKLNTSHVTLYSNPSDRKPKSGEKLPRSYCWINCYECRIKGIKYTYIPGDYLIVGLFPVHDPAKSLMGCSTIRPASSLIFIEAFNYAVQQANKKEGPFQNLNIKGSIGGLAFDTCYDKFLATYLLSRFHSGDLILFDPKGKKISPEKVILYVGGASSATTIALADFLKTLSIPIISYSATSTELLGSNYNHVLRSLPADDNQALSMIRVAKRMKWNAVSVVYREGPYGQAGYENVKTYAKKFKICISQAIQISGVPSETEITKSLIMLMDTPSTKVVILFHDHRQVTRILALIHRKNWSGRLLLMGTESWADRIQVIRDSPVAALSSLVMTIHKKRNTEFEAYFMKLHPVRTYARNPWLREFWQSHFRCCLPNAICSDAASKLPCDSSKQFRESDANDPICPDIINAVYAGVLGFANIITKICPDVTLCANYHTPISLKKVVQAIKSTPIPDGHDGLKFFPFTKRGDGNGSYNILQVDIKASDGSVYYRKVGNYSNSTDLFLHHEEVVFYNEERKRLDPIGMSTCDRNCEACSGNETPKLSHQRLPYIYSDQISLAAFIPVHHTGHSPFQAGEVSDLGLLLTETFLWAVKKVKTLNGGVLGGVVLDTYSNAQKASRDLFNLLSPSRNLLFQGLNHIQDDKIPAFITGDTDLIATHLGSVISHLKKVQIDYGTTLSNFGTVHGHELIYSLRTSESLQDELESLVQVCKHFDWTKIVVLYSNDSSGRDALNIINNLLLLHNICLTESIAVHSKNGLDFLNTVILGKLKSSYQQGTRIILSLVHPSEIKKLFAVLAESKYEDFIWVGGTWLFSGIDAVKGPSLKVSNQAIVSISQHKLPGSLIQHLKNLRLLRDQNPWLTDLEQQRIRNRNYTKPSIKNIVIRQLVMAVFAFGHGLKNFVNDFCPQKNPSTCLKVKRQDLPALLHKYIQNVLPTVEHLMCKEAVCDGILGKQQSIYTYTFQDIRGFSLTQHIYGSFSNKQLKLNLPDKRAEHRKIKSGCKDLRNCGSCLNQLKRKASQNHKGYTDWLKITVSVVLAVSVICHVGCCIVWCRRSKKENVYARPTDIISSFPLHGHAKPADLTGPISPSNIENQGSQYQRST